MPTPEPVMSTAELEAMLGHLLSSRSPLPPLLPNGLPREGKLHLLEFAPFVDAQKGSMVAYPALPTSQHVFAATLFTAESVGEAKIREFVSYFEGSKHAVTGATLFAMLAGALKESKASLQEDADMLWQGLNVIVAVLRGGPTEDQIRGLAELAKMSPDDLRPSNGPPRGGFVPKQDSRKRGKLRLVH